MKGHTHYPLICVTVKLVDPHGPKSRVQQVTLAKAISFFSIPNFGGRGGATDLNDDPEP